MKDKESQSSHSKDGVLKLEQLEEALRPFRKLTVTRRPALGWARAVREALGMTNAQLADRLRVKSQSIADMQESEVTETIKLQTLRKLAEALGCELVYAVVPPKPLAEMRDERARAVAGRLVQRISQSMKKDARAANANDERELERVIKKFLARNPKMLWKE